MRLLLLLLTSFIQLVNPFVGTGSRGGSSPGATYPFGMLQIGPDTGNGYNFRDTLVFGITQTRGLELMPATNCPLDSLPVKSYASVYSHGTEVATPGYYKFFLGSHNIQVTAAAGLVTGIEEFVFPKGVERQLVIDLVTQDHFAGGEIYASGSMAYGRRDFSDGTPSLYFFFVTTGDMKDVRVGEEGALLTFAPSFPNNLTIRIAVSHESVQDAMSALYDFYPNNIPFVKLEAEQAWEEFLGTLECPYEDVRKNQFYSALYRCAVNPPMYSDARRDLYPLLNRIAPGPMSDFLSDCMVTDSLNLYRDAPVFADAVMRGVDGFDLKKAFDLMVKSSEKSLPGLESFRSNGVAMSKEGVSDVARTVEFSYCDWCLAQIAKHLGMNAESKKYLTSSQYWRNVFDKESGHMRTLRNGRWAEKKPLQYGFLVTHDLVGLISAHGGRETFCARLDSLFSGQYVHGRAAGFHSPFLYAMAGKPEKTEEVTDVLLGKLYALSPEGICGNDRQAQMSAWYVLSSIGEYPVCPGSRDGSLTYVPKSIIVNPVFECSEGESEGETVVSITNIDSGCRAYYSIDGAGFTRYDRPFTICGCSHLEAYTMSLDGRRSFVTSTEL